MPTLPFLKHTIKRVFAGIARGKIAVIPTDTLYGIVCQALEKKSVEKIYRLRKRNPSKPCIILISSMRDLKKIGIIPTMAEKRILKKIWPAPVSVVLPCVRSEGLEYLHRGTNTLAVRLPLNYGLRKYIEKTGPLIAPSANQEGKPPATNIGEAKKYFGRKVDFYLDAGMLAGEPSTLISLEKGKVKILRRGSGFKKLKVS